MRFNLQQMTQRGRSLIDGFAHEARGSIAITVAVAAIPVFLAAGAAMDYFRMSSARAAVQASLDAGALAGAALGGSATENDRQDAALAAFEANLQQTLGTTLQGTPSVNIDNGVLNMTYTSELPTTLLALGGFDTVPVAATTAVTMRKPGKAEVVLVLDYSGSMTESSGGQTKYITMRNAAIDMVNGLTDDGENEDIHFGLVPFSHNVYTTLPSAHVLGASGASWTGCTYDQQYPHNLSVDTPSSNPSKWGQPTPTDFGDYPGQANYYCDGKNHNGNGYQAKNLVVKELSSDHQTTLDQLSSMSPYGYTHIPLGLSFGWHLINPGAPYSARSFDDEQNKKFIVLLTDGRQTTPAYGSGGSRDRFDGEDNLEVLCENVKNDNITVITIAFQLQHSATENRLRNCATDPAKHFFEAEDGNDLTAAFEEIEKQIAEAIYISK